MEWEHDERPRKRLCMNGVDDPSIPGDEATQSVPRSCLKTSLELSTAFAQYDCCELRKHSTQHEAGRHHGSSESYGKCKEANADKAKTHVKPTNFSNETGLYSIFVEKYQVELDTVQAAISEEREHDQALTSHTMITQNTEFCQYSKNQLNRDSPLSAVVSSVPLGGTVDQDISSAQHGVLASTRQVCFGMVGIVYSHCS